MKKLVKIPLMLHIDLKIEAIKRGVTLETLVQAFLSEAIQKKHDLAGASGREKNLDMFAPVQQEDFSSSR